MERIAGAGKLAVLVLVCTLFWQLSAARAGENPPPDAKMTIKKVALFKNGLAFVSSVGTLPDKAEIVRFGQLPVPSFGTFWVGYSKDVAVRTLITSMEEVQKEATVHNIGQLLRVNAGRKVTLRTGCDDRHMLEGTVLTGADAADVQPPEPPSPYLMGGLQRFDRHGRQLNARAPGNVLLVKTAQGIVAVNAGSVIRVDFEGDDVVTTAPTVLKQPSIRMELERPAAGGKVSITYLARGATWAPGYLIDLSDPETAKFSAHAVVVNELADFDGVQLELVTGFPNIKFGEVLNPVAMKQSLADFLNTLARGRTEPGRRGDRYLMTQQAVMVNAPTYDERRAAPVPGYSTAVEGQVSEDLFLYPVPSFTLKKNETAWIPLFTADMPYRHIYTWKIEDFLDRDERYREQRDRPDGKLAEEVWHSCRLVNPLKMPLTTGAAEFVKGSEFVGQDVCYYTAPGAETTIRINRAMNILAEQAEVETDRVRNAAVFHGYHYDQVKVRGELKLRSRLDKAVDIEVTKELSGEVLETSPEAEDVKTAKGLKQVNPKHLLTWKRELEPGEEQILSYRYQVYTRN